MPRVCTICGHAQRGEIDKGCVSGETNRTLARRFACSEDALKRHRVSHVPALLVQAKQAEERKRASDLCAQVQTQQDREDAHAIDVMTELRRCFQRVNLLFDACDRWLRNPDNPEQYDVGPRGEDVTVTYWEIDADGKRHRGKATISSLIAKVDGSGLEVERWESKHADPRELLVKVASQLHSQIELLAKLVGQLDERPTVNVTLSPEWATVRSALVDTLIPFPDARAALGDILVKLEAGGNGHRA